MGLSGAFRDPPSTKPWSGDVCLPRTNHRNRGTSTGAAFGAVTSCRCSELKSAILETSMPSLRSAGSQTEKGTHQASPKNWESTLRNRENHQDDLTTAYIHPKTKQGLSVASSVAHSGAGAPVVALSSFLWLVGMDPAPSSSHERPSQRNNTTCIWTLTTRRNQSDQCDCQSDSKQCLKHII